MTSEPDEPAKTKTPEVTSGSPLFNDLEEANELNSLASIAPGGTAVKSATTPEALATGTASELNLKFGASEGLYSFSSASCLPGCSSRQHMLSPQSVSSGHRSKTCVPLVEPNSGYSPNTSVASPLLNELRSDWRCKTARHLPCTARSRWNAGLNHSGVEKNGPACSSWEVIEEQQRMLEYLQQAICYCEERTSMGRALRSREAAVRARLLHEQLEQQSHMKKAREERNNSLINEAVWFSLQKAIIPHRPAAKRLGACLTVLHKHMQRSLSSSAFAVASTTPGIGGTRASLTPPALKKDHEEPQGKKRAITSLGVTVGTPDSIQQEASRRCWAKRTNQDSKASTSVLYEGAEDALAARELVQTRATLLLQKHHGNNSDSLQQLLSLEGEVRGQMALLGSETHREEPHSRTAYGDPPNAAEKRSASPPIPEETPDFHTHKRLPPSPPHRLIAHSDLRCCSNSAHISKRTPHQTNAPVSVSDSATRELQPAFGEQHWLSLARQVSLIQEVLLRNQQQHQKLQRKKRSDRQGGSSRKFMQTGDFMEVNASDSSAHSNPLDQAAGRSFSPPTVAKECALQRGEGKNDTAPSTCIQEKDKVQPGRRSVAEERLRRHRLRLQQQKEQKDKGENDALRQRSSRRWRNDGLVDTNNFIPVPDVQPRECDSIANAANSQCNPGCSNSSCGADTVHKVRSFSGTQPTPATPATREGLSETQPLEAPTALPTNTSQLTHGLPPMAKLALLARPAGAERSRAPSGQLRPYPPTGTPRLPVFPAAEAAAPCQTASKAELSDDKSKTTCTQQMLTQADSDSTTQAQRSSTKQSNPGASRQLASVGALPPPGEVADLLLGMK